MVWIWQHADWPVFTWDRSRLAPLEARFLDESGRRVGAWRHLADGDRTELRIEWLSGEALDTSAIEGEILDRASVQSSIRRHLGLSTDQRTVSPAEAGVAEMMVALHHEFDRPLAHETLWAWHRMLMREWRELAVIGDYRQHPEPMQVVSGPDYDRRVHYEAPPSHRMMAEMDRFVAWYGRIASTQNRLSALTWAGIAHLFFVCIHPFEDGNGRIGRALAEKALAQSLGEPRLIALSRHRSTAQSLLQCSGSRQPGADPLDWGATALVADRVRGPRCPLLPVLERRRRRQGNSDFALDRTHPAQVSTRGAGQGQGRGEGVPREDDGASGANSPEARLRGPTRSAGPSVPSRRYTAGYPARSTPRSELRRYACPPMSGAWRGIDG